MDQRIKWIVPVLVAVTALHWSCIAQTIAIEQRGQSSITSDLIGPVEWRFGPTTDVEGSFSCADVGIDIDWILSPSCATVRIATLGDLRAEVDRLPASTLKEELLHSLDQAEGALAAIRADGMSIGALSSNLTIIEKALDADFIDLVDDSSRLSRVTQARLLILARPLEQRYDYLRYIAGKVNRYARGTAREELTACLRAAVLHQADGKEGAYGRDLGRLLDAAARYRETMLKDEESGRIRYKADLLLRKLGELGTTRECNIDLSTTISGLDVDGTLSWEVGDYRAPSRDMDSGGVEIEAEYENDDWNVSFGYQREGCDYSDRLKDNYDKVTDTLKGEFTWADAGWEVNGAASYSADLYPNYIDQEIEIYRVEGAKAAVSRLIGPVQELSGPARDSLRADLDLVLDALEAGDRAGAVDSLNDFLDDVHDAAWAGDIDLTVSQPLIEAARGVLPRRRVRTIDVPFSLGFPSRNGDGRLEVEWEERIYPADSALDHTTTSGELEYIPWEGLTLDLAWERLVYPNASKKDRSRREWTLVATSTCSDWALTTTLSARSTVYPHVRAKDESVGKWELSLQGSIAGIDLALVGEDELTAHPNDATKPPTEMATIGLSATWTVENGTGKIELNEKTKEEQGNPISRMRAVELTWETSLTDEIDCSISANWNRTEDYTNATKDEAGFILKAEVSVPL